VFDGFFALYSLPPDQTLPDTGDPAVTSFTYSKVISFPTHVFNKHFSWHSHVASGHGPKLFHSSLIAELHVPTINTEIWLKHGIL
jgi:hypothetical protein